MNTNQIARIAQLVGEPARTGMLLALMDGRALTANELADAGRITPATASRHLALLVDAGLLRMERQGRHRYHRLASPEVARVLEGIMQLAAVARPPAVTTGPRDDALRRARRCYDHIAGRLGVAVTLHLEEAGAVVFDGDAGHIAGQAQGELKRFGLDLSALAGGPTARPACRPCLDWGERRMHLAGRLGALLCSHSLIRGLHAHYGKSHILRGVDLRVGRTDVVCLLGRNGSGRSTTLKAVMGLVPPSAGSVRLAGRELAGERPFRICRAGIGYVPEEREIFLNLSVDENLQMGRQAARPGLPAWTIERMFDYFPVLRERRDTRAGHLSGGEQQMLTICRSLLGNPSLLMIDEPTEGLAPRIVETVGEAIRDIHRQGVPVLLVEQKLQLALRVSTRVCVMGHGHIVFDGTPDALAADPALLREWLAV